MESSKSHPLLNKNVLGQLINIVVEERSRYPRDIVLPIIHHILQREYERSYWLPGTFGDMNKMLDEFGWAHLKVDEDLERIGKEGRKFSDQS